MRWFLLLVVAIIGLLFLYDPKGFRITWDAETPSPTPGGLTPITSTPLPPEEGIIGLWIGENNPDQLKINDDGTLELDNGMGKKSYRYSFNNEKDKLFIFWDDSIENTSPWAYSYKFKSIRFNSFADDTLTLTGYGRTNIYRRSLVTNDQVSETITIGPKPITITGELIGPDKKLLAHQQITLIHNSVCSSGGPIFVDVPPYWANPPQAGRNGYCPEEIRTTILTDSKGRYEFRNIEPQATYALIFIFSVIDPTKIRTGTHSQANGLDFYLRKQDSEISVMSEHFTLNGFEPEQTKVVDLDYSSLSAPPLTPTPTSAPVLVPPEVMATIVAPRPTSTPTTGTFTVTIPANQDGGWVDTSIPVQIGQTLTLTASGQVNLRPGDPTVGPNGSTPCQNVNCLMSEVPYGKVIARTQYPVGISWAAFSEPFEVGANLETSAPDSGKLSLAVNDHFFDDNTGAYEVVITLTPPE